MKFLLEKHVETYTEKQNALLNELLQLQKNHFIFVCDRLPLEDKANEYIRAKQYPIYEGGKKFFSLAIEIEQKFWISWFNRVRIEKVGAIKWEFEGELFGGILLELYAKPYHSYRAEVRRLVEALKWKFKCSVNSLPIDSNRQSMKVVWKK